MVARRGEDSAEGTTIPLAARHSSAIGVGLNQGGLTVPLLKRTDTRTGTNPPRKCRAASIAGARRVTSGCHLHNSEPRDRRDRNTRGGERTGSASPSAASGVSRDLRSFELCPRPRPLKVRGHRDRKFTLVLGLLGDVVQLAQTLLSRRLFLFLVNQAHVSPSAGSQVFHFLQTLRLVDTSYICTNGSW